MSGNGAHGSTERSQWTGAYCGSGLHATINYYLSEEEGRDSDVATVAHGLSVIIYTGVLRTIRRKHDIRPLCHLFPSSFSPIPCS